jgi:hypothetical protein
MPITTSKPLTTPPAPIAPDRPQAALGEFHQVLALLLAGDNLPTIQRHGLEHALEAEGRLLIGLPDRRLGSRPPG